MTEQNFEAMRRAMVESQLRTTGVNDPRVIAVMAAVPRERFVPEEWRTLAYMDRPVPVGGGRELNMPEATGLLLTHAAVTRLDRVLLVGAATGYTAALLAELAGEVVALEENAALAAEAVHIANVEWVQGPLSQGWAAGAPYDLIFIDGAVEQLPDALLAQLKEGGRLAAAIHEKGATRLGIGRKSGNGFGMDLFADCEAVRLPGFERPKSFVF
ncbi:protein-L-isoaspartate O-methyltransferase [Sphingomonas sp.]|jgi:protein-L-isoaspartate(D-aspartate) O-methyltransferase|uniref:protein-L-isoaspartate O-methyltransferase family protein n=1 Tax=Sphingomonas sp. TaxID=28214 RepID=UPI002DF47B81|nr:protein-L-isoaspartate O-methyltransferase [Sphingomonas sp.]